MRNVTRISPDTLPPELRDDPPSLDAMIAREPRGGPLDQVAIVKGAMNVSPMPGASEANAREAYRQKLIAGIRANEGRIVNGAARGGIWGLFLGVACSLLAVFGGGASDRRRR
jgi:hypothetical protein